MAEAAREALDYRARRIITRLEGRRDALWAELEAIESELARLRESD